MTDYTGKDKKVNPDKPVAKIDKVISGEVVVKKKGFGTKFRETFFGSDFKSTLRYLAGEVLLPAARNMIVDATTRGIEKAVYGDGVTRRGIAGNSSTYRPRVNYSGYSNPLVTPDPRGTVYLPDQRPREVGRRRDLNDIILRDRVDAEVIVDRMMAWLAEYDVVSVANLYEMLGLNPEHTDYKWGWNQLSTVQIRQVSEGYLIEFPPPEEI